MTFTRNARNHETSTLVLRKVFMITLPSIATITAQAVTYLRSVPVIRTDSFAHLPPSIKRIHDILRECFFLQVRQIRIEMFD